VLLAGGVGTFMSALDGSVVNTILPVFRAALHSEVATVEWAVTIYLLVVSGRLGDLCGHKRIYISWALKSVASSNTCSVQPGIADNSTYLQPALAIPSSASSKV
jgi:MFS family permease